MFSLFAGRQDPLPPPANQAPAAQPTLPTSLLTTKSSGACILASAICGNIATITSPLTTSYIADADKSIEAVGTIALTTASILIGWVIMPITSVVYESNNNQWAALTSSFVANWTHLCFSSEPNPIAFIEGVLLGVTVDTTLRTAPILKDYCKSALSRCRAALWGEPSTRRREPADLQQVVAHNPPAPPVNAAPAQPGGNPLAEPLLNQPRPNPP